MITFITLPCCCNSTNCFGKFFSISEKLIMLLNYCYFFKNRFFAAQYGYFNVSNNCQQLSIYYIEKCTVAIFFMLIVYVSALDIETLNIFYVFSTLNKVTLYSYEDFSCSSNLINYILHTQSYERALFVYLACLLLFASLTAAQRLLYIYIYIYTLYTHTCIYIYIYIYINLKAIS